MCKRSRHKLPTLFLAVALASASTALAQGVATQDDLALPLLDLDTPSRAPASGMTTDPGSGTLALAALGQGRWQVACSMATRVLARQVPDGEALGLFALCAAVQGDRQTAAVTLRRLKQVEPVRHYSVLAEAVLNLQDGAADAALAALDALLEARRADPLALYFRGEALHALSRDAEAFGAFTAAAAEWPDHVPALTAAVRLTLASTDAPADRLRVALGLAERATRLDPWQRAHWRLLAELCRRTGQEARAQAIVAQWLSTPAPGAAPAQ